MKGTSPVTLGWPSLIAGALLLLALGAGATYLTMRPAPVVTEHGTRPGAPPAVTANSPAAREGTANVAAQEVSVTLSPEAIQRAGIVVARSPPAATPPGCGCPGPFSQTPTSRSSSHPSRVDA